jgi:RNA polymerase subunit RPABC4/transcription elongation factor Spt4
MDFLKNVAKDVGKKSGKLVEGTKLTAKIASEESKMKKFFADLGEMVYNDYQAGESFSNKYDVLFSDINLVKKTIEDLRQEAADVKGVKTCSNCNAQIKQEARFCTNCGAPQDTPEPEVAVETKDCPNCGATLEKDAKFCPECGTTM